MSKRAKVFKIDDVEFELEQLGGVEGLDLFDRLVAELGSTVVGSIVSALGSKDPEGAIGFALMGAMVKLPPEFKMQLRTRFAGLSKINLGGMLVALGNGSTLDRDGIFDQHFAGRFGHMTKWLMECLKWSFVDFLPSSPGSDAKPSQATTSASPSPTG